ncbi:hypothetical protein ACVGVM_05385 [Pseudonocardia bannensis]|uniref:Uncharacterized protein n=1 Tax=Pseudonocardia bannensis TaxID=630973 RepID=A0A848DQQ4_9PSEU|nr:hypothetical protein [Pseudonocardia bannensis]NMH94721.1 hypothetical protein [Pseudonocardia bannensis]
MAATITGRARDLYNTWWTRGEAPRPLPPAMLRNVYALWLIALTLKVLGSSWDVSWHFKWLRDDLAPPHLLNTAGTVLVVALVLFHSYTGYGVDRFTLRFMQAGVTIFLLAVPLDVINHRINGLDITAWSITHALLYLGTAVMLTGVVRGWWRYGPAGRLRTPVLGLLWLFVLENVWFPAGQQEYGVLAVAAWDRGEPQAEPILLQFAADQIGRPVDRASVLHFALPVADWVYPMWLVAAAGSVLVLARWMIGRPWAATAIAAGYLAYRCAMWLVLAGAGFPMSAVPFLLLGVAVAVDLAFAARVPDLARPVLGAVLAGLGGAGAAWLQAEWLVTPPIDYPTFLTGAIVLGLLWTAVLLAVRARAFTRWAALTPVR